MSKEVKTTEILRRVFRFVRLRRSQRIERQKAEEQAKGKLHDILIAIHTTYFANGEDGFYSQALPFYEGDTEEMTGSSLGQLIYERGPSEEKVFRFKFQTVDAKKDFCIHVLGRTIQISQGTPSEVLGFFQQFTKVDAGMQTIPTQRHIGQPMRRYTPC